MENALRGSKEGKRVETVNMGTISERWKQWKPIGYLQDESFRFIGVCVFEKKEMFVVDVLRHHSLKRLLDDVEFGPDTFRRSHGGNKTAILPRESSRTNLNLNLNRHECRERSRRTKPSGFRNCDCGSSFHFPANSYINGGSVDDCVESPLPLANDQIHHTFVHVEPAGIFDDKSGGLSMAEKVGGNGTFHQVREVQFKRNRTIDCVIRSLHCDGEKSRDMGREKTGCYPREWLTVCANDDYS